MWTYKSDTNKYDLSFTLVENLSNGNTEEKQESITSINPLASCTYTANDSMSPDYTESFNFTAPSAPIIHPIVSDATVDLSSIKSEWTGSEGKGRNVKESYTLTYKINGQSFSKFLDFTFNKSTGFVDQSKTNQVSFNGQNVDVHYRLKYVEPDSTDINTSNSNQNN